MERDQQDPKDSQDGSVPDDAVFDVGTEPIGESDGVYVIGTDAVIGSQPLQDDGIYLIGTDVVGKSADPVTEERSDGGSDE